MKLLILLALAPLAVAQQGSISGFVVDPSGSSIVNALVKLSTAGEPARESRSSTGGSFSFPGVNPGSWRLTITAQGFAEATVTAEVHAGEALELPHTVLAVDTLATAVNVTPQTQAELGLAEVKAEEKQRLIGVIPNFFVTYDHDAPPLTTKQKLELTARSWFDPSSFVIGGIIAGVQQAENTHKGFGQGAQGYAKRYGASFADYGTMLLLEKVVTPTLFKQDPRYFYKGTGSTRSRFLYAVESTFICRGDNKKDQFCYSSLVNRFGTGFVTNYYYPAADRDKSSVILRNSAIGIGFEAAGRLFQEFVARKITKKK